ncbi:MAG: hypothetical protein KKG39_03665 [Gammaproteobacteria bacterium]|nr:hypothetical protein [Gammaproteobacteria bacterium]
MKDNHCYENKISELQEKYLELEEKVYANLPDLGYWIPMLTSLAVNNGNKIVDALGNNGAADHNANFRCLLLSVSKSINSKDYQFTPFFDGLLNTDEKAKNVLLYEFNNLKMFHDKVSASEGLWNIEKDNSGTYNIRLSESIKRSALHLLANKADNLSRPKAIRDIINSKPTDKSFMKLAIKSKLNDLSPITIGVSKEWKEFLDKLCITEGVLCLYQALVPYINSKLYKLWFSSEELIDETLLLNSKFRITKIMSREEISLLFEKLVPTLDEAINWGISTPFVKFNDWYLRWPFAYSVIHPNLAILATLMRKNPDAWNNTVGSGAAKVSSYLVSKLNNYEYIKVSTCKIKKNVGDIDIALFNEKTKELLICEVKTVFDRFRTNHQHHNFSKQRVNFEKAALQLISTEDAIKNDSWKLKDIFDKTVIDKPKRIYKLVLTWWDIFDPYKNTELSSIAVSNFTLFEYIFNNSEGNISQVHQSLVELSELACPCAISSDYAETDDFFMKWTIEKQTDALPPLSNERRQNLSDFSKGLVKDIKSFPEDWEEQARSNMKGVEYLIYE